MKKAIIVLVALSLFFAGDKLSKSLYPIAQYSEKSDGPEAYDALRFFSEARAFPYQEIPADAYTRAYEFYENNFKDKRTLSKTGTSWRSIGPKNVGGRTLGIAIDPHDTNVIWLGSASGGLWKSTTGGMGENAWTYVPTGFPVLAVSSIAINPFNSNEMYIGTGEVYDYGTSVNGLVIRTTRGSQGIGILKSSDKGITWKKSLDWAYQQQRGIWEIIFNPKEPNTVYAATTEGVFKTSNAGTTWINVLPKLMVMDLAIDPQDTAVLYAGVGNLNSADKGLFKSSNGGASWNRLSNGLPITANTGRISIDIYAADPNIVMVHISNSFRSVGLYRSFNKGQSWSTLSTNDFTSGSQGWYAKCIKMKYNDSLHVFLGGVYLYESFDGFNFTLRNSNYAQATATVPWCDMHDLITNPLDPEKIYLLTDAGLYRSNDFGKNFFSCRDGYVVSQFYTGAVSSTDSSMIIGGLQDRNSQQYSGSTNWRLIGQGDGTSTAIDQTNDSFQYSSSQYLNILKSIDRGNIFQSFLSGSNPAFVAPFAIAPSNHHIIYAGDINLRKYDAATGWANNGAPDYHNCPILCMAISFISENDLYFATAPSDSFPMHVFRSTAGGLEMLDLAGTLPNRYPRALAINADNFNEVYIVFSGFGTGHIFKSLNGGNSWSDISTSLPDIPFHCIIVNPYKPDLLFAGSDMGVFVSKNAGVTWEAFNTGLPDAVMVFDLKYSLADNNLTAFTHGHGVYKVPLTEFNVGLDKNMAGAELKQHLYPNPANDLINIEITGQVAAKYHTKIFGLNSGLVLSESFNGREGRNTFTMDVSNLNAGIYILQTSNGTRKTFSKFVKMR